MHRYTLSRNAMKSLRRIDKSRVGQIFAALDELAATENPAEHRNVKAMKGDWKGMHRLRIGSYRAIFAMNPDPEAGPGEKLLLLSVEVIGARGGIYG